MFRKIDLFSYLILIFGIAAGPMVFAADYGPMLNNARYRAMGSVGIALADDEFALFTNPAGLAGLDKRGWKIASVNLEGSTDLYDAYRDSEELMDNFGISTVNALLGRDIYFRGGASTILFSPGFAVAGFIDGQTLFSSQNQVSPEFDLGYMTTQGLQAGMGWSFPIGPRKNPTSEVRLGAAVKVLFRRGGYYHLFTSDLIGISQPKEWLDQLVGEYGTALGTDLGAQFIQKVGKAGKASFGISATDIPKTNFSENKAKDQPMNLGLGLGYKQNLEFLDLSGAVELQNLTQVDAFSNKVHVGLEAGVPFFKFWTGLNQMYFTWGLGVDLWLVRISYTRYSQEMGYRYQQLQQDRVMFQVEAKLEF